jgi:hypothetical protein
MTALADVEAVFPGSHLVKSMETPMPDTPPSDAERRGVLEALRSAYKLVAAQQAYVPESAARYLASALEHIAAAAGMVKAE